MNLVLINYVMKVLWPFLIRVSRNIRTFWTSTAVLALNKMSLWDFSSAFTDKYYQVHVLIPHPLMPTSPAGGWCWAGAVLCSDTEPSPRQTPTLVSTLPWASIPPALPLSGAVTPKLQSTRGLLPLVPWGLKGNVEGLEGVSRSWRLFVPEEAPHGARQGRVINAVNEVGSIYSILVLMCHGCQSLSLQSGWGLRMALKHQQSFCKAVRLFSFFSFLPAALRRFYLCQ